MGEALLLGFSVFVFSFVYLLNGLDGIEVWAKKDELSVSLIVCCKGKWFVGKVVVCSGVNLGCLSMGNGLGTGSVLVVRRRDWFRVGFESRGGAEQLQQIRDSFAASWKLPVY